MSHLSSSTAVSQPRASLAMRASMGTLVAGLLALVACSGDGLKPADFDEADKGSSSGASGSSGSSGIGGGSSSGIGGDDTTGPGKKPACATSSADAKNIPVYMVFVYDKSGSMQNDKKWDSCKAGVKSYFASPASKGSFASLTFFPSGAGKCTASDYQAPRVALTALPDPGALSQALDGESPNGDGTPTEGALQGALVFAKAQASTTAKDGKLVLVLVTDGEPNNCGTSGSGAVAKVAQVAAASKDQVPTFVIGVGNTGNLDAIAAAGGTNKALIVSTSNPAQTQTDLQKAIEGIRNSLACDYTIPAAPQGETFDPTKVNVVHTPEGGTRSELSYNQACSGPGWKYDDEKAPKKIVICGNSCDVFKASPGKVEIEYGCATKGDLVK
jgi:hypothetical protein